MRKLGLLIFLAVMLTACGSGQTTTIVLVVTATTAPDVAASPVPPTSAPVTNAPAVSPSVAQQVAASPVPPTATPVTPSPVPPTPTVSVFPTDVKMDIQVAYEDFQHGYMFWIGPKKEIWVLIQSATDPNKGTYKVYPDTFLDGEPESDPSLVPPTPGADNKPLFQPIRGFGKLWRTEDDLKTTLGWATTKEFSLNMPYVYQAGGYVTAGNTYVAQPGKHILTTIVHEVFVLSEGDNTWQRTA